MQAVSRLWHPYHLCIHMEAVLTATAELRDAAATDI